MSEFNFNSQICTSRSQSERLLALGLKKETADCVWIEMSKDDWRVDANGWKAYYSIIEEGISPAWSLHRLIEMMPRSIKCRNGYDYADLYVNFDLVQYRFYDTDYMHDVCYEHFNDGNVYSNVIDCIEWLIKEGYFNKEHLI